jgi:hypothetical protein
MVDGPCLSGLEVAKAQVDRARGTVPNDPMHIKLSTPRKLLWHYKVATPTIMPASKERPYDDHTTGGPCPP